MTPPTRAAPIGMRIARGEEMTCTSGTLACAQPGAYDQFGSGSPRRQAHQLPRTVPDDTIRCRRSPGPWDDPPPRRSEGGKPVPLRPLRSPAKVVSARAPMPGGGIIAC